MLPLIALVIIIFLIFLPEIIGIKTIEKQEDAVEKTNQVAKDLDQAEESLRPVASEAKGVTPVAEDPGFEGLGLKIGRFLSERTGKNKSGIQGSNQPATPSAISKVKYTADQLNTWAALADPNIQNHLRINLQQLDIVLTNVSVRYQNSRKDLLKFKEILYSLTQAKEEKSPNPQVLLQKLENQDLQVTTSLLKELVPMELLELWANVNLSSFYESNLPQKLKLLTISSFNPRMQIHDATYYILKKSPKEEAKLQSIGLNFALLRDGITAVKVFKNNIFVTKMTLLNDRRNPEWGTFHFDVSSGKDIYSIYIYGRNNQSFVKHYRFSNNFETLSLKEKEVKKHTNLRLLYASAEDNTVGQLNLIDELYALQPKLDHQKVEMADMEKF